MAEMNEVDENADEDFQVTRVKAIRPTKATTGLPPRRKVREVNGAKNLGTHTVSRTLARGAFEAPHPMQEGIL